MLIKKKLLMIHYFLMSIMSKRKLGFDKKILQFKKRSYFYALQIRLVYMFPRKVHSF